jgi:putative transposase
LDAYIKWYNEERIKTSLEGMSPVEHRRSLGLVA